MDAYESHPNLTDFNQLFSERRPFPEVRHDTAVIFKVVKGERPKRPQQIQQLELSDDIWEWVQMCWRHEPETRPSITSALNRLLAIAPGISLLERLSDFDPSSESSIHILRSCLESPIDKMCSPDLITSEDALRLIEVLDQVRASPLLRVSLTIVQGN